MKKIYIVFVMLLSAVAFKAQAQSIVPILGGLVPNDLADKYPTHFETYGLGGYRTVADKGERDVITTARRKQGMLVYVASEDKTYMLKSASPDDTKNVDGVDWVVAGGNTAWSLSGNAGTNPTATETDFIGTMDIKPVIFKAGGKESFRITPIAIGPFTTTAINFATALQMHGQPVLSDGGFPTLHNILVGNTKSNGLFGAFNVLIGKDAGNNLSDGANNFFAGQRAGSNNTSGSNNIAIGLDAGPSVGGLSNTVAIGNGAIVKLDNSVVLGGVGGVGGVPLKVGINSASPRASLDIDATDAIIIPVGNSNQRPGDGPATGPSYPGMLRFNNITNALEFRNNTKWERIDVGGPQILRVTSSNTTALKIPAGSARSYIVNVPGAVVTGTATASPSLNLTIGVVISNVRVYASDWVIIHLLNTEDIDNDAFPVADVDWHVTVIQ